MILQTIMGSVASTLCRTLPNSMLKLIVVVIILIIIFFPVAALPSLAEGDFDRNAEKFVGGDAAAADSSRNQLRPPYVNMGSLFTGKKAEKDQFYSLHPSNEIEENQESSVDKSRSRRRKGLSKPRRIKPFEPGLVLESGSRQIQDQRTDMIDMHESLALHHHTSPKSARSPTSVASPESLYMNEKPDVVSDNGTANSGEAFVKIRHMSNDDVKSSVLYDVSNSMQRTLSSEERQIKGSAMSENRSQEVPEVLQRSHSNNSASSLSQISSGPFLHSSAYDTLNGNPTNAIVAMAAAGMGLPTMIPTSAIMTSSVSPLMAMHQSQLSRESNGYSENRSGNNDAVPARIAGSGRGIIGSSGVVPRNTVSPTPEEKAQYKRPPHTYPALIASAILDSPGNLITLRGIYDYIMNNFPYYKYCHDKSAWQNSIRHNLSLNQCFVKVPRYENAAKSNYWTMTREGFEEFGNENSFKRRRRRGAALAPISAYKAKKAQNDGAKNSGRSKNDNKNRSTNGNPSRTQSDEDYNMPLPSQLMGLAAAWGPGLRADEGLRGRKRSLSPPGQDGAKQQKMMILQQGEGPTIGDDGKRPNSLSSVEEMQGALSSLSKNLLDPASISKNLPQAFQAWNPKNLIASSGLMLPSVMNVDRAAKSPEKSVASNELLKNGGSPILMEGIEVGSETLLRSDSSGIPVYHYRCGFCSYTYVSTSGIVLEQHVRMLHQLEVTNARAKAVAAAAVAEKAEKNDASKRLALQNLMSGLSSASIIAAAAAQNNANSFLASTQTSVGNSSTGYPYTGSFSAGLLSDSIMRSMAEQTATSQSNATDRGLSGVEALAYQRQQTLNSVIQQAAAAAVSSPSVASQDQIRSFYQQVMMQNPFLGNSGVFPRQVSMPETDGSNQLKQQLWQYQQQVFNQMKALSEERRSPNAQQSESRTSPPRSPAYTEADSELRKSIHGWKQCSRCNFTAKGDHGLELHYRKAHVDVTASQRSPRSSPNDNDVISKELSNCESKYEQRSESPLVSSAFPTPPLSNSPAYSKRHFVPLDLSGVKDDETRNTISATTQTSSKGGSRTCDHCDIVFGDEMMHALHMSCHDRDDPFKCKVCGKKCNERYYFNVHLLRGLHQNNDVEALCDSSDDVADTLPRCRSNGSDVASVGELNACQE